MERRNFDWADPFDLASQLTEEERMVAKTARDYAQGGSRRGCATPFARRRRIPRSSARWPSLGFLGATVSPEFGGAGLGYVAYA